MEKEMTTPDLYPLSINSIVAAANQRSSRDPVMDLSEDVVRTALDTLEANQLVAPARDLGRVVKYEHRIRTVLALRRDETAVLCLLFLRGAQTPGELRSRADRMFAFDDLAQLQSTLERLAAREEPLVTALPRQPGSRELRWSHLLGDDPAQVETSGHVTAHDGSSTAGLADLRTKVELLEERQKTLEEHVNRLATLLSQFGSPSA